MQIRKRFIHIKYQSNVSPLWTNNQVRSIAMEGEQNGCYKQRNLQRNIGKHFSNVLMKTHKKQGNIHS